jgi:hypothetical protein
MPYIHLMLWLFTFFFAACSGSSNSGRNQDDGLILIGTRVKTPKGRMFYLGAYATMPQQVDPKEMLLLGPENAIYSYGKHPYVWDGTTTMLKKYSVDKGLNIVALDSIKFEDLVQAESFGSLAFISDEEAYAFFLAEGKVIQFNPTTMQINTSIVVKALPMGKATELNTNTYYSFVTDDHTILLPIGTNPDHFDKFSTTAQVAVFNSHDKSIRYNSDSRMSLGYNNFAKDITNGDLYYRPSKYMARAQDYAAVADSPPTGGLLKVQEDGSFAADFFVDLQKILEAHCIVSVIYIKGKNVLVQYIEKGWKVPDDPGAWFNCPTKLAVVDLHQMTYKNMPLLDRYGTIYPVGELDGKQYFANFGAKDGTYHFFEQDDSEIFKTKMESLDGSGIYIARIQ